MLLDRSLMTINSLSWIVEHCMTLTKQGATATDCDEFENG
jgi:hypothetical protein